MIKKSLKLEKMNDLSVLRFSYNQNYSKLFMKQAFLPCPSCGGNRLFLTKYEVPLKILKDRSWLVCKDCNFQIPKEKYKKSLFCA